MRGSIGFAISKIWYEPSAAAMPLNPRPHTGLFVRRGDATWPARWSTSWWNRRGFVLEEVDVPGAVFSYRTAAAPAWLALLAASAFPLRTACRAARRLRRSRAGRCGPCGYDLRAAAGRCPECGALITGRATAA